LNDDIPRGPARRRGGTDIHAISKNASYTRSAKFVVFFVKDKGAPAVTPVQ
jgi:hypothetical protein